MKKRFFSLAAGLLLVAAVFHAPQVQAETVSAPSVSASAAVLIRADTGSVLYEKDADRQMPMASTTKILTCILALEQGNPDDWVGVSEKAASMPDVQLNMRAGERYRLSDLLYSLMLESHNDAAVLIAEHIGGSVEGFADLMNQKARSLDAGIPILSHPTAWMPLKHWRRRMQRAR
mgnify:CR=1 FL=1